MNETELLQLLLLNGGGAGAVLGAALIIRKFWLGATSTYLDTVKTTTESHLLQALQEDIDRVRSELARAKQEHRDDLERIKETSARDREELTSQITKLEARVEEFKRVNESMKAEALEAYAYLVNCEHQDSHCAECHEELKNRLMSIAVPKCSHTPEQDNCM